MISRSNRRRLIYFAKQAIVRRIAKKDKEKYMYNLSDEDGHGNTKSGIASGFMRLTESFGVKFSQNGWNYAADTFTRQRRAWRLKIAPFCFGFFSIQTARFGKLYCYITECAEILYDLIQSGRSPELENGVHRLDEVSNNNKMFLLYRRINKKCQDILNFNFKDCHWNNVGYLGRQLVVIDWGEEG